MPKELFDYIEEEKLRLQTKVEREVAPKVTDEPEVTQPAYTPFEFTIPEPPAEIEQPQWFTMQDVAYPRMASTQVAEAEAPPAVEEKPEIKPFELPKVWTEQAMEAVGKGISQVPILPKALEFIAPAFEFIHEKLEKPFAAIITAPWSPNLPWRAGESAIEHEKREYETWKAPTYVKGLVEFAMPLWWLPWFGWAGKGLKSLGAGNKMAQALTRLPKAGKLTLPASKTLDDLLFRNDFFKRVALWSEDKPILGKVIKSIGGPAAFVSRADDPISIAKRAVLKRSVVYDMRHGGQGLLMPKLQRYGDPIKLLDIADDGLVRTATPKGKLAPYLYDVLENPDDFVFANAKVGEYVKELRNVIYEVRGLAMQEGVKVPKEFIVHRIVKGKKFDNRLVESEFGSLMDVGRIHPTMEAGVKAGIQYGVNPNESVASMISYYFRQIATKRFGDEIKPLGKTAAERFATAVPDVAEKLTAKTGELLSAKKALQAVTRMKSYKGTTIPPATMGSIRDALPALADDITRTLALTPDDTARVITNVSRELRSTLKVTPQEFLITLGASEEGKFSLEHITKAVLAFNKDKAKLGALVEKIHKQAYQLKRVEWRNGLDRLQKTASDLLDGLKADIKPLNAQKRRFLADYRGFEAFTPEGVVAVFKTPSLRAVFRDRFFPKEIVNYADNIIGDKGQAWLKELSTAAGTGRMLVAAMDFSAPFIQGLPLLGRNPIAWLGAVKRQFEFFIKPQRLYEYMSRPEVMTIAAERWAYGGSRSSFEFFEALAPLQRVVGKIPKAGKLGQQAIKQTYGRAEAAFSGFGEVARNELWKVLRRPNMTDDQLRQVARTVDRMTGVMSMEALGIGLTQHQFENAFAFFAPRYTRAGLAYVADVFRGGIAGAEARKSLGALMASGFAMYYGISKALGQQPNLNPASGRFLTIKVGDDYIGIGGIIYGLMRLQMGVIGTAIEDPSAFTTLNRFDNPFVKFMYNRTSPLTSFVVNAVEQKNYLGEPFETPQDWARFLAEKVTPIALQRAFLEEHKMTPQIFGAEISGLRTFPKSAWELQQDAKDRIAQEQFGAPFESLPKLIQREIERMPEVSRFQEEIDEQAVKRGDALDVAFMKRDRDRDDARLMLETDLWQAQQAVDNGFMTPYEFRERLQLARAGYAATLGHIDRNPDYQEVLKRLKEPKDISKDFIGDVAYNEFVDKSSSGAFEDKYGIFDFKAYEAFKDEMRNKYGEDIWNYIQDRQAQNRAGHPPLAQEYYQAQEVLRPYWQVADRVEELFGRYYAESDKGQSFISKMRKVKRMANPEIARYIAMFYTR